MTSSAGRCATVIVLLFAAAGIAVTAPAAASAPSARVHAPRSLSITAETHLSHGRQPA